MIQVRIALLLIRLRFFLAMDLVVGVALRGHPFFISTSPTEGAATEGRPQQTTPLIELIPADLNRRTQAQQLIRALAHFAGQ